jgi:uncharacterized membrane protein
VKDKLTEGVKDTVGKGVKDTVGKKIDQAGGASGVAKEAGKGILPGGGGGGGDGKGKKGTPGVGKGRRMPVQQAVDIAVPLSTAYNQWTQFEEWPEFMHRVTRVTMDDDCTVSFATKIWGKTKEFTAQIETQRPDERIKWRVSEGITHTGVVTFHELAPRLTRIELNVDVDPGSLIEKAARGMRHVKRAMRADLHRFKAFIEMQELEAGAWRGVIEDGELVEEHPQDYDAQRESSDSEEATARAGDDSADEESNEPEDLADEPEAEADDQPEDVEHETEAEREAEAKEASRPARRQRSGGAKSAGRTRTGGRATTGARKRTAASAS